LLQHYQEGEEKKRKEKKRKEKKKKTTTTTTTKPTTATTTTTCPFSRKYHVTHAQLSEHSVQRLIFNTVFNTDSLLQVPLSLMYFYGLLVRNGIFSRHGCAIRLA
jgi:hypothetical protein